jgi:hypothetical protein
MFIALKAAVEPGLQASDVLAVHALFYFHLLAIYNQSALMDAQII